MKYYSTNHQVSPASLEEAVVRGLAADRGLFMPERIPTLDRAFIDGMKHMTFHEIALHVASAFFGDDMPQSDLRHIVEDTLAFDTPVVPVTDTVYSLELFHGPTLAFKDVGARFMARMLGHFIARQGASREVNVLVATSGDTGSAVANGFLDVPGIRVFVLYPKGKVSAIQECQFTTLGRNITALEVDGVFDACPALVKSAFVDADLNAHLQLTSANSINVARFLPQAFYYFHAYAQMDRIGRAQRLVVSVPSGNFGNLTAGLIAHRMGLPVSHFIAANNRNDVFLDYLHTGVYRPRPSVATLANAMDVGDPSNFARRRPCRDHGAHLRQPHDGRGDPRHPRRRGPHAWLHARSPRCLWLSCPHAARPAAGRDGRFPRDGSPGQVPRHGGDGHRSLGRDPRAAPCLYAGRETQCADGTHLRGVQGLPALAGLISPR